MRLLSVACGRTPPCSALPAYLYNDFLNSQAVLQYSLVIPTMTFLGALGTMCVSCAWQVCEETDFAQFTAKMDLALDYPASPHSANSSGASEMFLQIEDR